MKNFRQILARLLINQYGQDALNISLIGISFVLAILSLFDTPLELVFSLLSFILLTIALLRFFSRNISKRRLENQSYLTLTTPITRMLKLLNNNFNDRNRKYFLCPMCKQMVRIPRRRGRVEITCPTCHHHFKRHS